MSVNIKNILLAEDDRGTALVVKSQLEAKGYRVQTAKNGIEALKALAQQHFDLIITDVVMPEMDGVDLYGAIKQDSRYAHIPIIIVTDKAIFKESFSSLGVSNFVEKTTDISALINKIKNIEVEAQQVKSYKKVLIVSAKVSILQQMQTALSGVKLLVVQAMSADEVIAKALTMVPHTLVIDVLFQEKGSSYEVIKALRSFSSLNNLKVITYAYFPEDLGTDVDAIDSVKNAIRMCQEAGADRYIGRFNQGFFLEKILE